MKVGQMLYTGLFPAVMLYKTYIPLKSHAVLRDTRGIWLTYVLQKTHQISISSKIHFLTTHSWSQGNSEITGNRRRLTFLSSSIALSFSFSSSMVASRCPVSNFSLIWWLGMSFSAEYLCDFWVYCPSCWVCLSASNSFFTCKANKQQPSILI